MVALSSPILQITADVPVSDVRHQYRSDTICGHTCLQLCIILFIQFVNIIYHYFQLLFNLLALLGHSLADEIELMLKQDGVTLGV